MVYRYSHIKLIRLAGLIIWLSLSIPVFLQFETLNKTFNQTFNIYLAAHLGFGLVFWFVTSKMGQLSFKLKAWLSITLLVFFVLVINYITDSATGIFYALIISVLLAWLFPVKHSLFILLIYNLLIGVQFNYLGSEFVSKTSQYVLFFIYLGVSVFSFIISLVAYRQQNAKEELRMLNTELKATQVLLADSSRINERLRISRELHDLIGHHLTALTLNLEAASHMTEGKPQSYVKKAHSIARLLLSDVREVVGKFRQSGTLDLGLAVTELLEGLPGLKVEKHIPEEFLVEDPKLAQTILRCAQELITNTMKHAQATIIHVSLNRTATSVTLVVQDNGIGLGHAKAGNGMTGMAERVKLLDGTYQCESNKGLKSILTFPI
ncbi:signal transduction histidine kinase [Marinicella litoralis]|uniref:Signal transduction histidine kinase n=2 Tax=Marinicella litoralis TaxID=644220 RepID=A0A4R6XDU7_9GAMM|nr:signal transduction histidine kinase [Marinicella litoralis]